MRKTLLNCQTTHRYMQHHYSEPSFLRFVSQPLQFFDGSDNRCIRHPIWNVWVRVLIKARNIGIVVADLPGLANDDFLQGYLVSKRCRLLCERGKVKWRKLNCSQTMVFGQACRDCRSSTGTCDCSAQHRQIRFQGRLGLGQGLALLKQHRSAASYGKSRE